MQFIQFIQSLSQAYPLLSGIVFALASVMTTLQALTLFLSLKFPGLAPVAKELGVLGADLQGIGNWLKKLFGGSSSGKATTISLIFLALLLTGCTGSFEVAHGKLHVMPAAAAPRDTARCQSLDSGHRNWGAAAVGFGALSGVSGVTAIPVKGDTAKTVLISTSVVAAAGAAVSAAESQSFATSWAAECSQ